MYSFTFSHVEHLLSIQERLTHIQNNIGYHPITLVAVTKHATLAQMIEAYHFGIRDFGENKVQDAIEKMDQLPREVSEGVTWHFIGHLQKNKVNKTIGRFGLIHSIDSLELAQRVSQSNEAVGQVQPVLLQVNFSQEPSKHGLTIEEVSRQLPDFITLRGIHVKGLMAMAPMGSEEASLIRIFCGVRDLRNRLEQACSYPLPELSMGMSQDYMHAIGCDATIIRIGTFLFS